MSTLIRWTPAALLTLGAVFTVGIDSQRSMSLQTPLDTSIPTRIAGHSARDIELSTAELTVAAPTAYLNRIYRPDSLNAGASFFLYIGYYDSQVQGRTIHSPKNCLPGSGWEPLASQPAIVRTASGPATVNRYLLQGEQQQVLVLYWYQGRGRIQANEYRVKLDLLRDAAIRRRSDEALVRIVVPLTDDEDAAFGLATDIARTVIPALNQALPL
jgi:EpsI family protein